MTVENGSADKARATAGETVTVTADAPAAGKVFAGWTAGGGVTFADAGKAETTFQMPAQAVTVTASYRDCSLAGGTVCGPRGAVLILAEYGAEDGRMTSVKRATLAADCLNGDAAALLGVAGLPARCRLMLVDASTYAPLCAAEGR